MNPYITSAVAQSRQQDFHRTAERARVAAELPRRRSFAGFGQLINLSRFKAQAPVVPSTRPAAQS